MVDSPVLSLPDLDPLFAAELARRAEIRAKEDRDVVLAECWSLAAFVRNAWHILEPTQPYVHGWHIDAVCAALESVTEGWIRRLIINIPPGTMKSLLVSVFWPAWEWGPRGLPHLRYLTTSYEQELVIRDNVRMKQLVESDWYQGLWGDTVQLSRHRRGQRRFTNTAMGGREGRAFGSMTGGRGDRVIIDDPHSTKTADSDAQRSETTRLFREAIPSRVNNAETSAIVVIMQRLHQLDVTGIALEMDQGYVHMMLPMEYEEGRKCRMRLAPGVYWEDPREVDGELLFPDRFPRVTVERDKRIMGPYAVAGQFQQRPTPREGGLFKADMIEIVTGLPTMDKTVRAWDFAGTKKAQAKKGNPDWTAGARIGKGRDGFFYIVDMKRFQDTPGKVKETVKATASQDGSGIYVRIPQDPGQAGKAQVESYAQALAGYMLKALPVTGDKETRATPLASMVELGQVKMLKGPWNDAFLAELRVFPAGAHDDQVDAAADAFNEVAGIVPGEGLLEWYRQEAEKAAAEASNNGQAPVGPEGMVGYVPPADLQLAFGRTGAMYRPDSEGIIWLHPDDVAAVVRGPGWAPLAQDVEGA